MKNLLLILLIGSVLMFSCDNDEISDAQEENFVKFYTNFPEFTAADVAVTDDGYAVLGTARTVEGGTWICLIKTDKFGNSTDTARLYGISTGDGPANTAYCLKALSDGGFGILGSVANSLTGYRSAYFVRTNSAGDTLWTKTISGIGNLEAKYFDVSNQESFFMTGYIEDPAPDKRRQIWWFGIDKQGNDIRNQRPFGYDQDDEGTHLKILPDGGLIITGFVTKNNITKSVVIRTNENTVAQGEFYPDTLATGVSETGNCLFAISNDEYLLLGTSGNVSASHMTLRKIMWSPTKPVTVWTKNYDSDVTETSKRLLYENQSIYLLGTRTVNSSTTLIALTKTDPSGNITDRAEFGLGSKLSASAFQQTVDGGFIITGTNIHPEVNNTSVALIKTR